MNLKDNVINETKKRFYQIYRVDNHFSRRISLQLRKKHIFSHKLFKILLNFQN